LGRFKVQKRRRKIKGSSNIAAYSWIMTDENRERGDDPMGGGD